MIVAAWFCGSVTVLWLAYFAQRRWREPRREDVAGIRVQSESRQYYEDNVLVREEFRVQAENDGHAALALIIASRHRVLEAGSTTIPTERVVLPDEESA